MGSYQTITTNFFMGNQLRCQAAGLLGMRRANNQVAPHCPHKVYIQKPLQEAECSYGAADRRSHILVAQGDADTRVSERIC